MNSIFEGIEIVSTGVERGSSTKRECDKSNKNYGNFYLYVRNNEELLKVDEFIYNNYSKILYKDIKFDSNKLSERELMSYNKFVRFIHSIQ